MSLLNFILLTNIYKLLAPGEYLEILQTEWEVRLLLFSDIIAMKAVELLFSKKNEKSTNLGFAQHYKI